MRKGKGGFPTFTMDDYLITEDGEIFNIKWGKRKVKPQPNSKGYLRVHIAGKMHFVHRLVAEKYIPNPNNYPQVNHIDGDKSNNSVSNLEWVTNKQNREHAVKNGLQVHGERCSWAKLTLQDVKYIRAHTELTITQLAKKFGVGLATVRDIRVNKSWK